MTRATQAFEHKFIDVEGTLIHYAEVPSPATPMLLIHGIGMDWRVWQAISRRLSPHFHLYMPDLRGHGKSDKPETGYALADYGSDIETMIEKLGLKGLVVIGSSLGGMVTIVLEAPVETIRARILVDPPLRRGSGPKRGLFLQIEEIKSSIADPKEQRRALFDVLRADSPAAGKLYRSYMAETWGEAAIGVVREALRPIETQSEIEGALASIESPTLIMRGNQALGSVLTSEDAAHAVRLLPGGQEQYFESAGHAIHGATPLLFTKEVLRFTEDAAGVIAG